MTGQERSLSKEQAAALDATFVAALQEDLFELSRIWLLLDPRSRTAVPVDNVNRLAGHVAKEMHLGEDGVRNRLYGAGIPRRLVERERFMSAVQTVLERLFDEYGYRFESRHYRDYVRPVAEEADGTINQNSTDTRTQNEPGSSFGTLGSFDSWQDVRIGAWLADARNPAHEDHSHRITYFQRIDLLQYSTGDFYSIRRIAGVNVSPVRTTHLTYRESSERVFTMSQANVRAFSVASRTALVVDPELGMRNGSHTHAFRIFFPAPLAPGDEFDVAYAIRLPGELEDLGRDPEVMSVSLRRFNRGVERLRFEVVTAFMPQNPTYYLLDDERRFSPTEGAVVTPIPYTPREWYEEPEFLGLEWASSPWLMSWEGVKPNGRMYIAVFSGAPGI